MGILACVAGATGSGAVDAAEPEPPSAVPAGFTDTVFARVPTPTAVVTTPDGRKLVTDVTGKLRVVKGGVLRTTPALDITAKVCSNGERGLLGVAVDPNFKANHNVYLYYTFKKFPPGCAVRTAQVPVNRVSRFTMTGDTINPTSEKVLIDNMPSFGGNHNAGYVGFGRDYMLYISVGDGGCDYTGVTGCASANGVSRRGNTPLGKVLRITSAGGIPTDNPFRGAGTARCNVGAIPAGQICQETYMRGFRNPFRLAFDPNPAARFYINDVGQGAWEEIDAAVKGADYGWNIREGHCATGSTTDCGPPPAGLRNPIFDYGRGEGCTTITGGAFVPNGVWPANYRGKYLFADLGCGKIFRLDPKAGGGFTAVVFAQNLVGGPIAMTFGLHGTAQGLKTSLFYTSYANGGEVHVIDNL